MTETPHADRAERSGRGRTTVVWALIVVASIIGCTASATVWVKRQALDTNQWVKASDKLLDEPQIRTALSVYLVDQLYQNVDVGGQLQQLLPNDFKNLSGPISAALRGPATDAVERLLASSQFRARWEQLNRTAHQTLVNILEDKTKFSSTANGVVTLDLGELVRQLGQALGLPSGVLDRIPPDAGKIVVARSDQLAAAQKTYKVIKVASALLFILVIGLYALAVYLAHDRRKAIRNVGWAVIVVAIVLFAARRGTQSYVTSLVRDETNRAAASAAAAIGTALLRQLAWAGLAYGVTIVVWAVVAGPTRLGTAIRRFLAPALNAQAGALAGGAAALFLLLAIWQPTPAFGNFLGVVVLGGLYTLGVIGLRQVTLTEFPEASFGESWAHTQAKALAMWHRVRPGHQEGPETTATATATGTPGAMLDLDALERLTALHAAGHLSDDEYATAKAQLLGDAGSPGPVVAGTATK